MSSSYFNSPAVRGDAPMGGNEAPQAEAGAATHQALYESAYPGGSGSTGAAGASNSESASSYENQGLQQIAQGNQFNGIVSLLDAAQQDPNLATDQSFLSNLQGAISQESSTSAYPNYYEQSGSSGSQPTDTYSGSTATITNPSQQAGQGETQALQDLQSNPAQGVTELMTLASQTPELAEDPSVTSALQQIYGSQYSGSDSTNFTAATNPFNAENIAMQDLQSNPVQGIEELMQVASTDSNATQAVQPMLQQYYSSQGSAGTTTAGTSTADSSLPNTTTTAGTSTGDSSLPTTTTTAGTSTGDSSLPTTTTTAGTSTGDSSLPTTTTTAGTSTGDSSLPTTTTTAGTSTGDSSLPTTTTTAGTSTGDSSLPTTTTTATTPPASSGYSATVSASPVDTSSLSSSEAQAVQLLQTSPGQGILQLMQLAAANPTEPQNAQLLQALEQTLNNSNPIAASSGFSSSTTPEAAETAALQDLKTDPLQGIVELMQLASQDSAVLNDSTLLSALQNVTEGASTTDSGSTGTTPTSLDTSSGTTTPTSLDTGTSTGTGTSTTAPTSLDTGSTTSTPTTGLNAGGSGGATSLDSGTTTNPSGTASLDSGNTTSIPTTTDTGTSTSLPSSSLDTGTATTSTGAGTGESSLGNTGTAATTGNSPIATAEQQALQDLTSNPQQGILELMQIAAQDPSALQDPNLQQTLMQAFQETTAPTASQNFSSATDQTSAINAALQDLQGSTPLQGLAELMQLAAQDPAVLTDSQLTNGLSTIFESSSSNSSSSDGTDATQLAQQAVQQLSTNPTQGILSLMELTAQDPTLLQDPTLQSELLQAFDASSAPGASQQFQSANSVQTAETADLQDLQSSNPLQGLLELMQLSAQDPTVLQDTNLTTQLESIVGGSATNVPTTITADTGTSGTSTGTATDASTAAGTGTGTTATAAGSQATSQQVAGIESQALQMIQSGDPTDGVVQLMQLSQLDPSVTQDQTFLQSLQTAFQGTSSGQTGSSESSAITPNTSTTAGTGAATGLDTSAQTSTSDGSTPTTTLPSTNTSTSSNALAASTTTNPNITDVSANNPNGFIPSSGFAF